MSAYPYTPCFIDAAEQLGGKSEYIHHNLEVEGRFLLAEGTSIESVVQKLTESYEKQFIQLTGYNYTSTSGERFRLRQEGENLVLAQKIPHIPVDQDIFIDHEYELILENTLQEAHKIIGLDGKPFDKSRTFFHLNEYRVEVSLDSGNFSGGTLPPYIEVENTKDWDGSDVPSFIADAKQRIEEVIDFLQLNGAFTKKTMAQLAQK